MLADFVAMLSGRPYRPPTPEPPPVVGADMIGALHVRPLPPRLAGLVAIYTHPDTLRHVQPQEPTMTLTLRIETDNDAFTGPGQPAISLAACLMMVGQRLIRGEARGTIRDANGNAVGEFHHAGPLDGEQATDRADIERRTASANTVGELRDAEREALRRIVRLARQGATGGSQFRYAEDDVVGALFTAMRAGDGASKREG